MTLQQIEGISISFSRKHIDVWCRIDNYQHNLMFKLVEFKYDQEKNELSVILDRNYRYIKNDTFGLVPPVLTDDELSEVLILINLKKYFWYFHHNRIHYSSEIKDLDSASKTHPDPERVYSIPDAVRFGFLTQLERNPQ
ncbi:MAG TPA: hypothetical protein VIQ31_08735 [Phormidium sp.]